MDDAPERHIVGLWGGALAYPVAPLYTIVGCGALVGFNMIYEFPSFPCSQSSGLRLVIAANHWGRITAQAVHKRAKGVLGMATFEWDSFLAGLWLIS